ncbi:hypothetical protein WR25_12384 [Diploscapter pachys]|uniref:AAA+ ATPase domain-containing protein n=1 Tax=Diploscapter pachys TaxID=2018661 RepID=A0A2A2JA05_9BILA|nr:hypothetical protein WR25_12384 [Diploscapter pachys]
MNDTDDEPVCRATNPQKMDGRSGRQGRKRPAIQVVTQNEANEEREIPHIENSSEDDDGWMSVNKVKRKLTKRENLGKMNNTVPVTGGSTNGKEAGTRNGQRKASNSSNQTAPSFRRPRTPAGPKILNLDPIDFDKCAILNSEQELAVHATKVKEMKKWLDSAFEFDSNRGQSKCLLIAGPSGGGKSTAIELLCRLRNIELLVWESEFLTQLEEDGFDSTDGKNELEVFFRFLRRSHRSFTQEAKRNTLLLVSFLPDEAFKNVSDFRSQLQLSLLSARHPIIFCFSNISAWEISHKRIFTKEFISDCQIAELNMNACATTMMKKAIKRVAEKWIGFDLPTNTLDKVVEVVKGDLRSAMNILRMCPRGDRDTAKQLLDSHISADQDDSFHMMGRILYAKRQGYGSQDEWPVQRPPTERDVNQILEMSTMTPSRIVEFLHEHHLAFSPNIKSTCKILDTISAMDSATSYWETRMRADDEYNSQTVARTIMYHNYPPVVPRDFCRGRLYAFHKPKWWTLDKEIGELKTSLRELTNVNERGWMPMSMSELVKIPHFYGRMRCLDHLTLQLVKQPLRPQWTSRNLVTAFSSLQFSRKQSSFALKALERAESDLSDEETWHVTDSEEELDSFDDEPVVVVRKKTE